MGIGGTYTSTISAPEIHEWTQMIVTDDNCTNTAIVYKQEEI